MFWTLLRLSGHEASSWMSFWLPMSSTNSSPMHCSMRADFQNSEVISPSGDPGVVDYDHRRSRVLMDLGKHQDVILERIRSVLPRVLEQLGMEEFPVTHVEAQITASNDGDFFCPHSDDAHEKFVSRTYHVCLFLPSRAAPV